MHNMTIHDMTLHVKKHLSLSSLNTASPYPPIHLPWRRLQHRRRLASRGASPQHEEVEERLRAGAPTGPKLRGEMDSGILSSIFADFEKMESKSKCWVKTTVKLYMAQIESETCTLMAPIKIVIESHGKTEKPLNSWFLELVACLGSQLVCTSFQVSGSSSLIRVVRYPVLCPTHLVAAPRRNRQVQPFCTREIIQMCFIPGVLFEEFFVYLKGFPKNNPLQPLAIKHPPQATVHGWLAGPEPKRNTFFAPHCCPTSMKNPRLHDETWQDWSFLSFFNVGNKTWEWVWVKTKPL